MSDKPVLLNVERRLSAPVGTEIKMGTFYVVGDNDPGTSLELFLGILPGTLKRVGAKELADIENRLNMLENSSVVTGSLNW